MTELRGEQVWGLRVAAQRLSGARGPADTAEVVGQVFALQAQDDVAATLGVWARSLGLTAEDVRRAREVERSIVRTWCLRGTLHLVCSDDVRWLLELLRPRFHTGNRARRAQLGLDDAATARGVQLVRRLLAERGPQTRAEVAEWLAEHDVPSQGQATIHVIWRAAMDGVVCYGPCRDGTDTFVLVEDWLRPTGSHHSEEADTDLARRFLRAYGPARPEDLAAWSGLGVGQARRAWSQLGSEATQVQTTDGPMWILSAAAAGGRHKRTVSLLPAFDGLWLGYTDGFSYLSVAHKRHVYPGGGIIRPTILVDGQLMGTWTRRSTGGTTEVRIQTFAELDPRAQAALHAEVEDLGRFLGQPSRLRS